MSLKLRIQRLERRLTEPTQRLPPYLFDARAGQRPKSILNPPPELDCPDPHYDPVPFPYTHVLLRGGEIVLLTALGFPDLSAEPVYRDGNA